MKLIGLVYIIAGIVALIGAALTVAVFLIPLIQALNVINTANPNDLSAAGLPPGTDLAALQEQVRSLTTVIMLGWVWIASVILSGIFSVYLGITTLKIKKKSGKAA